VVSKRGTVKFQSRLCLTRDTKEGKNSIILHAIFESITTTYLTTHVLTQNPSIYVYYTYNKMARLSSSIAILLAAISYAAAFSTAFLGSSRVAHSRSAFSNGLTMRVVDIDSEDAFDKTVSSAGASLVVVDYSTTWCGPCKGECIMHHIHTHDGWMDCKIPMRCRYFPDLTDGGSKSLPSPPPSPPPLFKLTFHCFAHSHCPQIR
jgi:thiol-disulfide isomerase/thioredoxin